MESRQDAWCWIFPLRRYVCLSNLSTDADQDSVCGDVEGWIVLLTVTDPDLNLQM
eukprot:m.57263 g.57263  ORF g.57263 m.57263 type:complete len:55 (+) comp11594_c0_seq3:310-474(+)